MTDNLQGPMKTKWILAPTRPAGDVVRAGLSEPRSWVVVTPQVLEFAPDLPAVRVTDYLVADWPEDAPLQDLRRRDDVIELLESRMDREVP